MNAWAGCGRFGETSLGWSGGGWRRLGCFGRACGRPRWRGGWGFPAAIGGRVGKEGSAGRGVGAEGGAAGKAAEAPCGTIEAGGETVGAWSAGDAAEEVDGAAGGGVD